MTLDEAFDRYMRVNNVYVMIADIAQGIEKLDEKWKGNLHIEGLEPDEIGLGTIERMKDIKWLEDEIDKMKERYFMRMTKRLASQMDIEGYK
jgi:hypothetical protein